MKKAKYPEWICSSCAEQNGGKMPETHLACWHFDECGVCGYRKAVTQPRDFGYPKIKKRTV